MPVTKVIYEHPFNLGPYAGNEKVGFEYEISDPFENPENVLDRLHEMAVKWLNSKYPQEPTEYVGHKVAYNPEPKPAFSILDVEYESLKKTVEEAKTKETAMILISKSNFKLVKELHNIANSKQ